ncbi:MAG TPA: type II CRISPR RNA-guided endonuclease Cas9 [Pirellulaceae bacterium]|nr:type II CRISPR RNA-guided endonuclease Cas9 [Pirellulaceae bacterium]HMO92559.1 type II CRISPR RNA-guided endonuclease Cas9 [Pirellulaceae bacterium]HMP70643.1 type II CRISPR RNA-guided endonuclease Cas9 [Pirellulaceae bacterium]
MNDNQPFEYTLGLDIGVSSIGWALVAEANGQQKPARLLRAGVHLFEAGIDSGKNTPAGALESGNEQSLAKVRRDARSARRRGWRKTARKRKLLRTLIRLGFLPNPKGRLETPIEIDCYLKEIDSQLKSKWEAGERISHSERQLLPYRLRAACLDGRLEPIEIGRALYHLAQRRGFYANRKIDLSEADAQDGNGDGSDEGSEQRQDDLGKVKAGILSLAQEMDKVGARTLGEFFASLDPTDPQSQRIRNRYTDRKMYQDEFNKIWDAQYPHNPNLLTNEAKSLIYPAIFFQRPLKSQKHLIGKCSLLPHLRRAKISNRRFQRFRILQQLNDLQIIPTKKVEISGYDAKTRGVKQKKTEIPDTNQSRRSLTDDERSKALRLLEDGDASFREMRNAGIGPKLSRFNFEEDERTEKKLIGNRTDAKLKAIFGPQWDEFTEVEKDAVYADCVSIQRIDTLEKRATSHWNLSPENARRLATVKFEDDYGSLSVTAINRLLPRLENGEHLETIRNELFPDRVKKTVPAFDLLPPLEKTEIDLPAPAIRRALTEVRKVVNAIIRKFGKPVHIRIELLRELKKGKQQRKEISKRIGQNEKERKLASDEFKKQYPQFIEHGEVSRDDVEKIRLANECGWICPYTGRQFCWDDLFVSHTVEVEHIWPRSRSLDNSFANKTLCFAEENRSVKKNKMPSEVYDDRRLSEILERVARFSGRYRQVKMERFEAKEVPSDFTNRHFNESSYIARAAGQYVAYLYGGQIDDERRRRVHVTSGGVTAWLRRLWGFNQLLGDSDEKNRHDHRHHAIDAIVIAMTTPDTIRSLQTAAARAEQFHKMRLFDSIECPFELEQVRNIVSGIVVSHRQSRRVRGKLHKDSIYSRNMGTEQSPRHHIRKAIELLTENEIDKIVDPRIKEIVKVAWAERKAQGARTIGQAFGEPTNRPQVPHGKGWVYLRRVRISTGDKPVMIGGKAGDQQLNTTNGRFVNLGANHHIAVYETIDGKGRRKLQDRIVSLLEAMERVRNGLPVVDKTNGNGQSRFIFSLCKNDFVEMDNNDLDERIIMRVSNISHRFDVECIVHSDGTPATLRKQFGGRIRLSLSKWIARNARKVRVTYLGEVENAGG